MMTTQTSSNIMSYLSVPASRMARSTSHESFATDVSVLSLSSFAASDNAGSRSKLNDVDRHAALDELLDGADAASTTDGVGATASNADLMKLREDMLEQMLEYDSMSLPQLASSRKNSTSKRSRGEASPTTTFRDLSTVVITNSERNLLNLCVELRPRGSLYKSFSTTDLTFANRTFEARVKHCTSQAWIPSDYAQVIQCRKRHLKDLKELNSVDFVQYGEGTAVDNTSVNVFDNSSSEANRKQRTSNLFFVRRRYGGVETSGDRNDDRNSCRPMMCRKAASDENITGQMNSIDGGKRFGGNFLKKLRFSKEVGCKIRDDLLRKLGKQKQQLITNLDLEHEKGRPLSKLERNFMIFHWLQSLDDQTDESSEKP